MSFQNFAISQVLGLGVDGHAFLSFSGSYEAGILADFDEHMFPFLEVSQVVRTALSVAHQGLAIPYSRDVSQLAKEVESQSGSLELFTGRSRDERPLSMLFSERASIVRAFAFIFRAFSIACAPPRERHSAQAAALAFAAKSELSHIRHDDIRRRLIGTRGEREEGFARSRCFAAPFLP